MLRLFSLAFAVIALAAGLILASPSSSAQDDEVLDCEDFASQADAQAAYRADPSDQAGNDADGDGIACELYDGFEDAATDLEPIDGVGANTSTTATTHTTTASSDVSTVASAGAGSAVADAADGTGMAAIAGTLVAAAGCGAVALRGLRRA